MQRHPIQSADMLAKTGAVNAAVVRAVLHHGIARNPTRNKFLTRLIKMSRTMARRLKPKGWLVETIRGVDIFIALAEKRRYREKDLSLKKTKEVFNEFVEAGAIDTTVAEYVLKNANELYTIARKDYIVKEKFELE